MTDSVPMRVAAIARESTRVDSFRLAIRRLARQIAAQPAFAEHRILFVDRLGSRGEVVFAVFVDSRSPLAEELLNWIAQELRREARRITEGWLS